MSRNRRPQGDTRPSNPSRRGDSAGFTAFLSAATTEHETEVEEQPAMRYAFSLDHRKLYYILDHDRSTHSLLTYEVLFSLTEINIDPLLWKTNLLLSFESRLQMPMPSDRMIYL